MKMTATGNQMRKEKGAVNVTGRDTKEFKGGRNSGGREGQNYC